jgi:hypothetical protein
VSDISIECVETYPEEDDVLDGDFAHGWFCVLDVGMKELYGAEWFPLRLLAYIPELAATKSC